MEKKNCMENASRTCIPIKEKDNFYHYCHVSPAAFHLGSIYLGLYRVVRDHACEWLLARKYHSSKVSKTSRRLA